MSAERFTFAGPAGPEGAASDGVSQGPAGNPSGPKRIIIYGMNYAPEPIGVGRYTAELGAHLASQGVDVEVVTAVPHYPGWATRDGYRNRYHSERLGGTRVFRCPLLLRADMQGIWRVLAPSSFAVTSAPVILWRILRARPDAVLCIEPTLFCAPVALLAARLTRARAVLHVQDLEIDAAFAVGHVSGGLLRKAARSVERFCLRAFDKVVTISNRMRDRLHAKGVQTEHLTVVRNWVDLTKIRPLPGRSSYRDELGLSDDTFVALYAGNIGPKQALPVMLDAAAILAKHEKFVFIVAGAGPEKEGLVAAYGHLPNLRFLPVQPEERLCEFLNLADVHILPQQAGTADLVLPSKLGGMLASGKPCIVMADPGTELHDFCVNAAIIVPPGDSMALADAIEELRGHKAAHDPELQLAACRLLAAPERLTELTDAIFFR